jgi:farnesyl diphosphate synthase
MTLQEAFEQTKGRMDGLLRQVLHTKHPSPRLHQAMAYAVENGGKRLRPFLVYQCADVLGISNHPYLDNIAAAIELIHSYSLVHDDLPDMDNSPLRRGKPSCWQKYGATTAILVGDALQPLAFEVLAQGYEEVSAEQKLSIIHLLATASGAQGMVAGQMMDMFPDPSWGHDQLCLLQSLKTGMLIDVSCVAPGILANASSDVQGLLRHLAHNLGLMYQILDDILDETGAEEQRGKPSGQDEAKRTFVKIRGLQASRDYLSQLHDHNLSLLEKLGQRDHLLGKFSSAIAEEKII